MNANQIVNEVLVNKKTLLFVSKGFCDKSIGTYVKGADGSLTKVHGKSAKIARAELMSAAGVCRSYGKGVLTVGDKNRSVFLTGYVFHPELL